ncbi:hypothetical protein [Chitinolyticbacter meiyuanensis]|uniref:hypothetical protein n=1 Tax=Chitinolyticbacter meiyuanensis TaxID=682798 RepID=UPI0011E59819|nr:hypothetical protein [Chitinolyticbacter meiyuanensis]
MARIVGGQRRVLDLGVSPQRLAELAGRLRATPDQLAAAGVQAVNAVLPELLNESRATISRTVRLNAAYIRERTDLRLAAQATAGVGYLIARERETRLATYQSRQVTTAAPRAKGDSLRGIAPGRKQAGISVAILRSESPSAGSGRWFYVPLKRGKVGRGNGFGIFERTGPSRDDIRHLYGPSVARVFGWELPGLREIGVQRLETALRSQLNQLGFVAP